MANCIFRGAASPAFSPLEFNIELPCYEACWEASTASDCLEALQRLPQQMRVSAAIRELRKSSVHNAALFEASAFGMDILVKGRRLRHPIAKIFSSNLWQHIGLHCLLHHASQCDPELFFNTTGDSLAGSAYTPHLNTQSLLYSLQQDLSGSTVTSLANEIVSLHNSVTLKHVNSAFDAWRATWDMRHYRERGHEGHTFFSDPLPFWWLGKLYMILHCHSSDIPCDSEFAVWRVSGGDERDKLQIQFKIRGWLARFRKVRNQSETSTQSYLSKILRFSEHG